MKLGALITQVKKVDPNFNKWDIQEDDEGFVLEYFTKKFVYSITICSDQIINAQLRTPGVFSIVGNLDFHAEGRPVSEIPKIIKELKGFIDVE